MHDLCLPPVCISGKVAYLAFHPSSVLLETGAHGLAGLKLVDMAHCMALSCAAHAQPPPEPRPSKLMPYEAPEQLAGDRCGAEADVWAFGCIMAQMITGGCSLPVPS